MLLPKLLGLFLVIKQIFMLVVVILGEGIPIILSDLIPPPFVHIHQVPKFRFYTTRGIITV